MKTNGIGLKLDFSHPQQHRMLTAALVACVAVASGCGGYDTANEPTETSDDNDGALGEAESQLTVYSYSGSKAGDYAATHWSDPSRNTNFLDYTASGGDCTNFANQAILAGLCGFTDNLTVFKARLTYTDKGNINDWWYTDGTAQGRATPEWTGANGLFTYLKWQAAHPTYAGIRVSSVYSGSQPSAAQIAKGDILSLSKNGTATHSMVVTASGATLSQVNVAYRSGICENNSCPATATTLQNYINTHILTGWSWNVFHVTGFAK